MKDILRRNVDDYVRHLIDEKLDLRSKDAASCQGTPREVRHDRTPAQTILSRDRSDSRDEPSVAAAFTAAR